MRHIPLVLAFVAGAWLSPVSSAAAAVPVGDTVARSSAAGPASAADLAPAAVSCPTVGACVAVGSYHTSAGPLPLGERWDGSTWTIVPVPLPDGAKSGTLQGISCTTVRDCIAVGSYTDSAAKGLPLAEQWDGASWTEQRPPTPSQGDSFSLAAVSCTSPDMCIAVGAVTTQSKGAAPQDGILAERWNGASWTLQPAPGPGQPGAGELSSVSCLSASDCTAVGRITARWDGTSWTPQRLPVQDVYLTGVSCTSHTTSIAVGSTNINAGMAEIAVWTGSDWSIQPAPLPSGGYGSRLYGISCARADACTAVGAYYTYPGLWGFLPSVPTLTSGMALAERWDGTTWSIQPTPNGTGIGGGPMSSVSCAAASACVAVGSPHVAEQWNGTAWTIQPPPLKLSWTPLSAVSCVPAHAATPTTSPPCMAVGASLTASGTVVPLAERWNGTTWMAQGLPLPGGSLTGSLLGISCPATNACMAVGEDEDASGTWVPLAERWDGGSWTPQSLPAPPGSEGVNLTAVSCSSGSACMAVGWYVTGPTAYHALAERWDGQTWTAQTVPDPGGCKPAPLCSELVSISCPTATMCLAVGDAIGSDGKNHSLVERWDGTAWAILSGPQQTVWSWLKGVSCLSATSCTVAGNFLAGLGDSFALAARWNGKRWSNQLIPVPQDAANSELRAVSCPSAAACTAIYAGSPGNGGQFIRSEQWNGKRWNLHAVRLPAQAPASQLISLSCASVSHCIAVGTYPDGAGNQLPLAQQWNGKSWTLQSPPLPEG